MGNDWYEGCWRSREWRLNHLYWIETKSGVPMRFRLNVHQKRLLDNMWSRNYVLKARQLGMSTLISVLMLDSCLFIEHFHAGIIDRRIDDAKEKLGKMKFALDCMQELPAIRADHVEDEGDREKIRLFTADWLGGLNVDVKDDRIRFRSNKSDVRAAVTMRGGTLQMLHVSEYGSIAANFPKRAREIKTGAIEAVPKNGTVFVETTHEGGKWGLNYEMARNAMDCSGRALTELDFRFFFFPWYDEPDYRLPGDGALELPSEVRDYFAKLEREEGAVFTDEQKRWYMGKFKSLGYAVRQEYPSMPEEAFAVQIEGAIYGSLITRLRAQGRLNREFEASDDYPLYVSWDLGRSDNTSMWLVQPGSDGKFYVLDHYTAHDMETAHYFGVVRQWEAKYGQTVRLHLIPHDGVNRDPDLVSYEQRFLRQRMRCQLVPRVRDVWDGIQATRRVLRHCVFHARCDEPVVVEGVEYMSGLNALENYRTGPVGANGVERPMPLHDATCHSADAFRYFAEAFERGFVSRDAMESPEEDMGIWGHGMSDRPAGQRGKAKGVW